jgi:hypothetical protein
MRKLEHARPDERPVSSWFLAAIFVAGLLGAWVVALLAKGGGW